MERILHGWLSVRKTSHRRVVHDGIELWLVWEPGRFPAQRPGQVQEPFRVPSAGARAVVCNPDILTAPCLPGHGFGRPSKRQQ
eukprot:2231212-Pyramimonas_sp.AAC.1